MLTKTLQAIFLRDLAKLKNEIELYQDEAKLWITTDGIANSAGNLCLHLLGNLNTYIGAEIGKTGYVRNRALEFSLKNIPQNQLLDQITATMEMVSDVLGQMDEALLQAEYPLLVFDKKTSYEYFLVHLTTHLTYHLGQINYHRRLLVTNAIVLSDGVGSK